MIGVQLATVTKRQRRIEANKSLFHSDGRIDLGGGFFCHVNPEDMPLLMPYKWSAHRGGSSYWYARERRILMHVLLMGKRPGFTVDHKDGNGLNNCRSNLRWATRSQNAANVHSVKVGKSGFRGVHFDGRMKLRPWVVIITANCVRSALGYFATPEEAARAYDAAAIAEWGEFATALNFPLP